jgi:hypothetical protein
MGDTTSLFLNVVCLMVYGSNSNVLLWFAVVYDDLMGMSLGIAASQCAVAAISG